MGPADIDVVAGIGDYLVAGTAALANTTGDTFKNFPEVSFAMGKTKAVLILFGSVPNHLQVALVIGEQALPSPIF